MLETRIAQALSTICGMKKSYLMAAIVAVLAVGAGGWWFSQRADASAVQYRTAKIERGPLQATVSASGAVNPVTQVSVGTQVSGQIRDLYVDFNSEVKAGQLIAQIDPETFEYRVRSAQADVDAARAATLTQQAALAKAKVDSEELQRDFERKTQLVAKQFIAASEAEKAQAMARSGVENVKLVAAQLQSAQAGVAQREASLAQARIDLQRTRITSPVNGIVIKRAIEKGQTVAASLQSPELFVIAQNLQDMQVDASIDESDVGRIRTGQKATFTVDAFPGQTFEGQVRQVRKAAQNVANVVTYVAVVGFSNTGGRLLPGMTANVRVVTDSRENVLKVPNSALRVRIAGVEPAVPAPGSGPARPGSGAASGATTGEVRGGFFISQAMAQAGPGPGPGGGGGGGMAALRERLVAELQLSAEQQAKLDAVSADMRPRFAAIRELPEEQRRAAREQVMSEMRQKISAFLTPPQQALYQRMQEQAGAARAAGGPPPVAGPPLAETPRLAASPRQSVAAAPAATSGSLSSASAGAASSAAPPSAGSPAAGAGPGAAGGAPGAGGPLAELRNRLVTELQLSAAQVEKVDAIYADARPRFGQLRELSAEERPKARERIMADVRARIGDLLTPEQKAKYAALLAESAGRGSTRGRIYLLDAQGKPRAYNVRLGISDGTSTELLVSPNAPEAQELKEGASVIVGTTGGAAPGNRPSAGGPRMPF